MKKLITDYLDQTVNRYPDKIAFSDEHEKISFKELREQSLMIADAIMEQGLFHEPIAVYFERSIRCICSMLGVLYSGNYYAVLDVDSPDEYSKKLLSIFNPKLIISDQKYYQRIEQITQCNVYLLYEDMLERKVDEDRAVSIRDKTSENDIFSVCYTSGSSGVPKGAVHSHRSLITNMDVMAIASDYDSNTIFGNQFPFTSAGSTEDIYITIMQGCTTYLIPNSLFLAPAAIADYIFENNINSIYWVSSALNLAIQYGVFDDKHTTCLKKVKFCGESLSTLSVNELKKAMPNLNIVNQLGSTEMYCATFFNINSFLDEKKKIPIGVAYNGVELIVIDEYGNSGNKGELYIRSPYIASSYYNDPELTDRVFVQNPLHTRYRDIVFRTGDIVEKNGNGELVYVGRKDFQIKRNGRRIELEEIENTASTVYGVREVGCVYEEEKQWIYLFYSGDILERDIEDALKKLLPRYMLPNRYVSTSLPHNQTGKIDRQKLMKCVKSSDEQEERND